MKWWVDQRYCSNPGFLNWIFGSLRSYRSFGLYGSVGTIGSFGSVRSSLRLVYVMFGPRTLNDDDDSRISVMYR